jgi:AcrR family transcriptional regulator
MTQPRHADGTPIWSRPGPGTRSPRFSREQIAAAALAIADADGFEHVSMRRIASALGAGTMSLYRYIATKADLLALIDDALLGEALLPGELPSDWQQALAAVARQTRSAYLRHPWAAQALQGRAAVQPGPNGMRHFEQSLAAVAAAPLDIAAKLDLLAIVADYVYGNVLHAAGQDRAEAAAQAEFVRSRLESGDFPRFAAIASDPAAISAGDRSQLDRRFEFGLWLLIDGVAAAQAHG